MGKRTRQMKDYQLKLTTKAKKEHVVTFRSKQDCLSAMKLLSWFSGIVLAKDKIQDSVIVVLDREKTVKEDELINVAGSLATK